MCVQFELLIIISFSSFCNYLKKYWISNDRKREIIDILYKTARNGGFIVRPVSVFIIRLIEKVLLARDENWKQKFIRSDILYFPFSIIAINYYLSTVTSYNFINTFQKYTIERGKKKFEMRSPPSRWIRVKVGSSGYPRNFKFNVLDSNGIQNDFLLSSLVDEHARVARIEIHVAYVTFSSPVLPAGLFGNTFFMNIPDMFCDLLELPLCRST